MRVSEAREFWKKSQRDLIFTQATALAYTTLLSIVPILAVAFFLFKAFGGLDTLLERLEPVLEQNLAPSFSDKISFVLEGFVANVNAGAIGVIGMLGFVLTSISTLVTIEKTFNHIWGVRKSRTWGRRVTTYWSLLTIGPVFIGTSIMLSTRAYGWLKGDNGAISHFLVWAYAFAPYMTSGLLFSGLFLIMPNVRVRFKDALKSGFITGAVFEFAKMLYAIYATRSFSKQSVYGSLAVLPVFLVWLYVVWLIVLYGAELCCFFSFKRMGIPYKFNLDGKLSPFVTSDILEVLGEASLKPNGGLTAAQLVSLLKIPVNELIDHLDYLESEGWIVMGSGKEKGGPRYLLAVPLERINMSEILTQVESQRYVPKGQQSKEMQRKLKGLWAQWDHKQKF